VVLTKQLIVESNSRRAPRFEKFSLEEAISALLKAPDSNNWAYPAFDISPEDGRIIQSGEAVTDAREMEGHGFRTFRRGASQIMGDSKGATFATSQRQVTARLEVDFIRDGV
jgi:hypothetical protein